MASDERPCKAPRTETAKIDRSRIYAVIPARAGSKGVKGKNIKDFCGKPLMAWAINNGLKSKYISRTFVSTDSEEYRQVALKHGAEVPFLRPAEIAHDTATDYQLFEHFLKWMQEHEPDRQPSLLVQLRPTGPCVSVETVDACIEKFLAHEDNDYDSLRTVTPADHEPFNMYFIDPANTERLTPLIPQSHHKDDPSQLILEPQSVARQILPKIFWHNAYVDIVRPRTVREQCCVMGKKCLVFHMALEDNVDIDTPEQWAAAEVKKRAQLEAEAKAA
uniref:N-acylneuraminate cytidylyltransferase n=1 Tax=Alexandrium catenella TaxID=2925 RepID=A0A7S1RJD2_ALECA